MGLLKELHSYNGEDGEGKKENKKERRGGEEKRQTYRHRERERDE